ncbi:hypothetical protein TREMEDRAFT_37727 [Tremella mesenterica DSM 1558]|uniref:uncharacterized protein n=1 Tax=Tremella mesenterica (strain ATCC 24925 / CBS 8224 / DSM 1558 / NBRC 9311 / NRRL Y-6157 / RJB 2259-6 / UBC 559-6) TaxID=578456 RepID=UPI0003F490F5|nr:uncharacterized protein TREMEDRAFT_37727 [Tremella mesenterica DSM 1558]EIW71296.1 hypothetical protein TREMEDRAFT_37727 [Tremella mesenterica DSM 1558]
MASGIPTRRLNKRADENAPLPTTNAAISTRSRAANVPLSKPVQPASSLPVMRRQYSSTTTTTVATNILADSKPPPAETKKRSALGEVQNVMKTDKGKKGLGAKEERKPLANRETAPQAQRRTRSAAVVDKEVKRDIKETKRKATTSVPISKLPARSRSTTASTSTVEVRLKEKKLNVQEEDVVQPARKKRKTSSPALIEAVTPDIDEEALYDHEGRELVLSSGSKGTSMRSPKRVARSKDAGWTDLDAEDEGDPTMVSEYVIDAFKYMMSIERATMPSPDYMDKQSELQWPMRRVLMDWIIEVHTKFRLLPETLFIAVNLVDRFLTERVVSLVKFQLVGLTALFVAAKYEEVICPSVSHFLHMTDGGYTVDEILKAERYMLSTLNFDMSYPNPLHFLRRISKADGYDIQTRTVSKYLIEISCVDNRLIKFPPSLLAAAAMFLARMCLDRGDWTPNLVHYSTYSVEEILECSQTMLDHLLDPEFNTDTSFYKKYASKKHMKSSFFVHQWAISRWPESVDGTNPYLGRELEYELSEI